MRCRSRVWPVGVCALWTAVAAAAHAAPATSDAQAVQNTQIDGSAGVQLASARTSVLMAGGEDASDRSSSGAGQEPLAADPAIIYQLPAQASAGLVINATADAAVMANPAIVSMILQAISIYQSQFADPITVNIYFRYATTQPDGTPLSAGNLATSNTTIYRVSWASYINALRADARTANDVIANASLPPSALSTYIYPSSAGGRAVGLSTPGGLSPNGAFGVGGTLDGIVTLNSAQAFQFTRPTNATSFDALRSTEHEIDEVLGLGSFVNYDSNRRPQDLFAWSAPGVRSFSSSGTRYLSINSGSTNIVGFNQQSGGDYGDWFSPSCPQPQPYVQNAFSCRAQYSDVTPSSPEGINLDVIGYDLVATAAPGAPSGLTTSASGSTVFLSWSAPTTGGAPTTYIIEAGSSAGQANLANFATGTTATTFSAGGVAAGSYYVRVRAANASGTSAPSNESLLVVGSAPGAPRMLTTSASGTTVLLSWAPPTTGGPPSTYIIEAGSARGAANLANFATGSTATTFSAAGVAPGAYYVRVRAANSAGTSAPSNDSLLVVSCTAPAAPVGFVNTYNIGGTVAFSWLPSPGATSYVIEAGSASTLANLANADLGSPATTFITSGVGPGLYFVRLRARNACGISGVSTEIPLLVR